VGISAAGWNVSVARYYVRVYKVSDCDHPEWEPIMDEREFPESGQPPEDPETMDGRPTAGFAPDPEWDAYVAWREQEIAAGRDEEPPAPREIEGPAVSISLGSAADIDPALLAAVCGPDGMGGDALGPQFGQDAAADVLQPSPVLAALTEQAADDLSRLTDNQLIGALHAARRLENRTYYLQTRVIAEYARRCAEEFETAKARGVPVGCRAGEFPGAELASELLISRRAAGRLIDAATDLTTRLPKTLQGMSSGLIDADRAATIAAYTASLTPGDAAEADEILSLAAPQVRGETLARRAAALEMKLDPEATRKRKESMKRLAQRVEVRLERSGNASVAGRELDVADALASKANIHIVALRLRRAGLEGTLDRLRTMVYNDLLQGHNPFDRLAPIPEAPDDDQVSAHDQGFGDDRKPQDVPIVEDPADDWVPKDDLAADGHANQNATIGTWPHTDDGLGRDEDAGYDDDRAPGAPAREPVPMPAVINLLVHAGTLFGWDTTPSQASGWGLLGCGETRDIVHAASMHPQTRWCTTVIGFDGTAIAHGCSSGRHSWSPATPPDLEVSAPPGHGDQAGSERPGAGRRHDGPDARQAAQFAELLHSLNITLEPIAKRTCDHRHAEDHYTPSRKLQHLVRARTATCTAPGCQAEAIQADLDHTIPYPEGLTDECNLGPKCRGHHRAKQAPGWKVEQPEPGVFRWTLPSGRTHTTRPTTY
jgi:Domain of unknown function (DUF222)